MNTQDTLCVLNIVVPCFNEEEVIEKTAEELGKVLDVLINNKKISEFSRITFVDDCSRDNTFVLAKKLHNNNPNRFAVIKLSRNRGHQNALLAGLLNSPGDALVSIDADLQDDVNAIIEMVNHFLNGSHIVYGVRTDRTSDSYFKKMTAEGYYKFLKYIGVDIVFNHADFRLMSRKSIEELRNYKEANLFLRGIIPQLGFKSSIVEYTRLKRFAGESKYPLRKMLSLAINGALSFSIIPLRMAAFFGLALSALTVFVGLWVLWGYLNGNVAPGWSSTMISVFFLGGVQLVFLGVIGEYIGKIYLETKRRPAFIIEEIYCVDDANILIKTGNR